MSFTLNKYIARLMYNKLVSLYSQLFSSYLAIDVLIHIPQSLQSHFLNSPFFDWLTFSNKTQMKFYYYHFLWYVWCVQCCLITYVVQSFLFNHFSCSIIWFNIFSHFITLSIQMNQLCKVCGEPAAGYHFGAFTCEGCKVSQVK